MEQRNPYAPTETTVLDVDPPRFSRTLTFALILPVAILIAAIILQVFFGFPRRSLGAGLTALAMFVSLLALIIPVPIAITKLIRHRSLRSTGKIASTVVATIVLSLATLFVVAVVLARR